MQLAPLGRSNLRVSRIALGCMSFGSSAWRPWVLDEPAALPMLARAAEHGINLLDTANVYSTGLSEEIVGRFVRAHGPRERWVVATKLFYPVGRDTRSGLSRAAILGACDASLHRLGLDAIDLLQIHRWDPDVAIEETMSALGELVRVGKVRALGASNLRAWQLAKANFTARALGLPEFVAVQAHYNLLYREEERELLPLCVDQGIAILPWSPLARGRLARGRLLPDPLARATAASTASTARAASDEVIETFYGRDEDPIGGVLSGVARELGTTSARVALAWLLGKPGIVAPVLGVTKLEHLDDAVAALDLRLDAAHVARLEAAYTPRAHLELPWTSPNIRVLDR